MKYLVKKGCQWGEFSTYGMEGQTITAADLASGGKPLPGVVIDVFLSRGALELVKEGEDQEPPKDPPK